MSKGMCISIFIDLAQIKMKKKSDCMWRFECMFCKNCVNHFWGALKFSISKTIWNIQKRLKTLIENIVRNKHTKFH